MRAIQEIDRDIDAINITLERLETIDPFSAESWQDALNIHPDLDLQRDALWLERGLAQKGRDEAAHKTWARERRQARRQVRKSRPVECPTCGNPSYTA